MESLLNEGVCILWLSPPIFSGQKQQIPFDVFWHFDDRLGFFLFSSRPIEFIIIGGDKDGINVGRKSEDIFGPWNMSSLVNVFMPI